MAFHGSMGVGIDALKSNSKECALLLDEIIALKRRNSFKLGARTIGIAVSTYDSFGETAWRIELPPTWTRARLVELHRGHRRVVTKLFEAKRGLAELVLRNPEQLYAFCWDDEDILDPLNLKNVSSLLALLLEEYAPAFDGDRAEVEAELEHALEHSTTALTQAVDGEVRGLVELFRNILSVLNQLPGLTEPRFRSRRGGWAVVSDGA
jgi:hypothetical protein